MRFEGALCRFGFFAGEGASSNIVVLRRDIAQVVRWKPPYCPHRHLHIDQLNAEMAPPRGNVSAVAGMVDSHVGWPSTSQNALPGTGLTGCCAGRPSLIETLLRRHEVCNARFAVLLVGL